MLSTLRFFVVIPTKAGIYLVAAALVGKWIPAFAGMTMDF
jgi:hypothetical protein